MTSEKGRASNSFEWRVSAKIKPERHQIIRSKTFTVGLQQMECTLSLRKAQTIKRERYDSRHEDWEIWLYVAKFTDPVFKRFLIDANRTHKNSFLYDNKPSGDYMVLTVPNKQLFVSDDPIEMYDNERATINVRWCPNYSVKGTSLSEPSVNISSLLESKEFSDMAIEAVNGLIFPVHKAILSARSPVFFAMLKSEQFDSQCIQITEFSMKTVSNVIEFIYTGRLSEFSYDTSVELMSAADKYELPGLKYIVSENFLYGLNTSNATDLLLLADESKDDQLKNEVLQFISEKRSEFSKDEMFDNLKQNPDLLISIINTLTKPDDAHPV